MPRRTGRHDTSRILQPQDRTTGLSPIRAAARDFPVFPCCFSLYFSRKQQFCPKFHKFPRFSKNLQVLGTASHIPFQSPFISSCARSKKRLERKRLERKKWGDTDMQTSCVCLDCDLGTHGKKTQSYRQPRKNESKTRRKNHKKE